MNAKKNLSIETLRGIAILLVVMGHVIGSGPTGGMKIDFPHPLRYLYVWIDYIQMPLFTAIAGWVYALKPFSISVTFKSFFHKKVMRLLIPMAVVGTLYFFVQYIIPGTNRKGDFGEIWRIYVFPYTIYWYLPSLFLIFMVQWIIDCRHWMQTTRQWIIWCIVSLFLSVTNDMGIMHLIPNLFSFKGALGQLPYFFAGVAAYRFHSLYHLPNARWFVAGAILSGFILIQLVWYSPNHEASVSHLLYGLTLIPVLFLLLNIKWKNRFCTWIGGYAYSIYLFHGFGTSGGRILLKAIGINSTPVIFIFATIIAVCCSIMVDALASRFKWSRKLLLGVR